MNESDNELEAGSGSSVEELRSELQSLRAAFSTALVLLMVLSLSVNFYLFRQVTTLGMQEKQISAAVAEWAPGGAKQNVALQTWAYFLEFSKTHPDFQPFISKYSQYFNTNQAKPAAAALAAPKK